MFEGYLFEMLRTLLALAGVCLLAWGLLRALARRGWGKPFARAGGIVEVIERVPIDARRSLVVVRAGERVLLVGLGDTGAPSLVAELDPSLVRAAQPAPPASDGSASS